MGNSYSVMIRPAERGDIPALWNVERHCFQHDRINLAQWRHLISPKANSATLVAIWQEELVGYIMMLFRKRSLKARVYSLAVLPKAQGLGIGSGLLEQGENLSTLAGARMMNLEVRLKDKKTQSLYHAHGFFDSGTRKHYYADGADALCMIKRLGEL